MGGCEPLESLIGLSSVDLVMVELAGWYQALDFCVEAPS